MAASQVGDRPDLLNPGPSNDGQSHTNCSPNLVKKPGQNSWQAQSRKAPLLRRHSLHRRQNAWTNFHEPAVRLCPLPVRADSHQGPSGPNYSQLIHRRLELSLGFSSQPMSDRRKLNDSKRQCHSVLTRFLVRSKGSVRRTSWLLASYS